MKPIYKRIVVLLAFLSLNCDLNCQTQLQGDVPSSTIYLVRTRNVFGSVVSSNVYIPDQQPFELKFASVVKFKVYSEGNISIECRYEGGADFTCKVDVQRGNEYYVMLNGPRLKQVSKERVKKFLKKPKHFSEREENLDHPIIRPSVKSSKTWEGIQASCFLISSEGFVVTNYHCIEDAEEINIKGIDGDFITKYEATVVASDRANDLALLKIKNADIKFDSPVFAIRSSGVMQAEKIYALGFPSAEYMGTEIKITEGIISAKSGVNGDISKFQISAAVNPGNSGGTLIDEKGNLIGVVHAKSTIADAAGYAIKASYLDTFLKSVEDFNYIQLSNTIESKSLPEKVESLKKGIFILEAK